ncbi:MAG: hypothetical protein RKO66_08580 [Candidatus Contendobacter sp.]|nr:hypothetical protein [Candidatus Contendobacter sp.]MDS4060253.1 hypothetical protein [Candidatus Contendobacter sp.]
MKTGGILVRSRLVFVAIALASSMAGANANADENQWIVGTWQLAEDKKNPGTTDDFMDFDANGAVVLRDSKKTYANCTYALNESVVLLKCIVGNKEKPLTMHVSSDKKSLVNPQGDVYRKPR